MATPLKLKGDVLSHPPYSPDLAPSDHHLFGWRGFEEARDSGIMMRSLQLCKVGYTSNQKPSSKLESRSFQNIGTSVWQSTGTTLKSSV
jgi:hypothetical protein